MASAKITCLGVDLVSHKHLRSCAARNVFQVFWCFDRRRNCIFKYWSYYASERCDAITWGSFHSQFESSLIILAAILAFANVSSKWGLKFVLDVIRLHKNEMLLS